MSIILVLWLCFQFYLISSLWFINNGSNSYLWNMNDLVYGQKLYTRLMYPFDCTMTTGVYLITILGTALGCTYSLGGVQLGG